MFDILNDLVENRIQEAMRNGEFDNLPSQGKPIDLTYWASLPEEIRAGYMLLKNGGFLPEEAQLLKDIDELSEQLTQNVTQGAAKTIAKKLEETRLKYNLLVELRKRSKPY